MFFVGSIETGERIAALRKSKEWSQSELGEKIGLTQASVSEIERGVKRGSVESLKAIADALDTDIGYLLTSFVKRSPPSSKVGDEF